LGLTEKGAEETDWEVNLVAVPVLAVCAPKPELTMALCTKPSLAYSVKDALSQSIAVPEVEVNTKDTPAAKCPVATL
jgi:hypothetical protein